MYMCVRPDSRSATYQDAKAAGIQRQSGTPANHRFSTTERTNRTVAGKGAAFIIAGSHVPALVVLAAINGAPQRTSSPLVSQHDGRRRDKGIEAGAGGRAFDPARQQPALVLG